MTADCVTVDDVYVIDDVETLRVVADPLRLRLLEQFRAAPRTVKEVAAALGMPATRLYYHVHLLEERGLLRVIETRCISGILEKHYQTRASRLSVDRSLLGGDQELTTEGLEVLLSLVLDEARAEIARSVAAGLVAVEPDDTGERSLMLGRVWLRLTPERAVELRERLVTVVKEYVDASDGEPWEVLLGVYPIVAQMRPATLAGQLGGLQEPNTEERP